MTGSFDQDFQALTGKPPFPWQRALFERFVAGDLPTACDIPTGLGKTSVIAIWLIARAHGVKVAGAPRLPTRLVYVVNRRTVVDQTTEEVERLRKNIGVLGLTEDDLALSTLRGQFADNRAWSADPSKAAVICGTVDMIGSRLLFSGYGVGFKTKPLHAGFLGQDTLLVHDEAHLEPAFQTLIETVRAEQLRRGDLLALRVMALTATSRGADASVFVLTEADRSHAVVKQRIHATKKLTLHEVDEKKELVDAIVKQALSMRDRNRAIVVFLRTVDDVDKVVAKLRKEGCQVTQLTGTMRGYEREKLIEEPVFRRFLPDAEPVDDGAYLVCTSAGEVGVNLSADDLLSDLSTFDSMAQRFGRVNRFGKRDDSEVHVYHPAESSLPSTSASKDASTSDDVDKTPKNALERDYRRFLTIGLLRLLEGDASPDALSMLDPDSRKAAFSEEPEIPIATDMLFDAWALTTVRTPMPGRPPVAAYLHGVEEFEPPSTTVAWREEVQRVTEHFSASVAQDLLADFPIKPHETLSDSSVRIAKKLESIAELHGPAHEDMRVWLVAQDGTVDGEVTTMRALLQGDTKRRVDRLRNKTVLLSPKFGGLEDGLLSVVMPSESQITDVADRWGNGDRRKRVWDDKPAPEAMRLIRTIEFPATPSQDGEEQEPQVWRWFELPKGADSDGSLGGRDAVLLDVHSRDVEGHARRIVASLRLDEGVKQAVIVAARLHDLGKVRRVWQRSVGNRNAALVLAKSGDKKRRAEVTTYRHELGSVLDAPKDPLFASLAKDDQDLALHLIAAHHGRARPHFPDEERFDPEARGVDFDAFGTECVLRFSRLQRRFGRWHLAYLESLVRAADYAASAAPSEVLKEPS
jgi:CRISPR-associated endonuclease/helicase Cas3